MVRREQRLTMRGILSGRCLNNRKANESKSTLCAHFLRFVGLNFKHGINISFSMQNANDANIVVCDEIIDADGRSNPASFRFSINFGGGPMLGLLQILLTAACTAAGTAGPRQGYLHQLGNICTGAGCHRAPTVRLSLSPARPRFTSLSSSGSNLCGFGLDFTPKLSIVWRVLT